MKTWVPGRGKLENHLWEYHGLDAGKLKGMTEQELDRLHKELHGSGQKRSNKDEFRVFYE